MISTFAVPAFASSYPYDYTFSGSGESWGVPRTYYSKEDDETDAWLSIHDSSNWRKGVDRVYLWVQNTDQTELTSSSKYFTDYVTNELLHYKVTTSRGEECGLAGWHNNNNISKTFSIQGLWTP